MIIATLGPSDAVVERLSQLGVASGAIVMLRQ